MKPNPRHRFTRIAARSLLLGALTTLFIAWPLTLALLYFGAITHQSGARFPCDTPTGRASFTCSRRTLSDAYQLRPVRTEDSFLPLGDPQPLPSWVARPHTSDPTLYHIDTGASGWPMRAFASESWQRRAQGAWNETLRYNILLATTPRGRIFLPLRPLWSGLILNTLMFAAAWCLLGAFARWSRRAVRRRRGRCAHCGYDLRGLSRDTPCPECGTTPRQTPFTPPAHA